MDKNLFEKEKIDYDNIKIPQELDFLVKTSLKKGKLKYKSKRFIYNLSKVSVATFLAFLITINLFPKVSILAQGLPIIGKLAEVLTFDNGLSNAVNKGLVKNINYEEEINGIKFKVNNIVGDSETLWIDYELSNHKKYDINMVLMDAEEKNLIISSYGRFIGSLEEDKSYLKCNFDKFSNNFVMIFNIFPKKDENNITTFKIKVNLEDKFNSELKDIIFNNKIISTDIGEIEIKNITTSTTRTNMLFKLNSEEYEFMGFENPILTDSKGKEYPISNLYSNKDENGNENIEFQGEIKDGNLVFKCDGIYYARRDNRNIKIDLLNKRAEENDYDIEVESIEDNLIILHSENTSDIDFKRDDEVFNFISRSTDRVNNKFIGSRIVLELIDKNKETLELYLERIMKDKAKGLEFKLN